MMRELDSAGFIEGTIALSMFCENSTERKALIKKSADAGNPEGLWEYCAFLPHSYVPDPNNSADALWEKYCLDAAEEGDRSAMFIAGELTKTSNKNLAAYWYGVSHSRGYEHSLQCLMELA